MKEATEYTEEHRKELKKATRIDSSALSVYSVAKISSLL
jgi:hypothetical protein